MEKETTTSNNDIKSFKNSTIISDNRIIVRTKYVNSINITATKGTTENRTKTTKVTTT